MAVSTETALLKAKQRDQAADDLLTGDVSFAASHSPTHPSQGNTDMPCLTLRALLLSTALLATPLLAHDGEEHRTEFLGLGQGASGFVDGHVATGDTSGDQDDTDTQVTPVFVEGLGDYGFPLEGVAPDVQTWFDQGLGHLWGFNHAEAVRAFQHAQALDAACSLCLWGEAYALGPNLNDIMHPEAEARAWEAAEMAAELARTPLEQALTQALLARYAEPGTGDRAALNQAFADAMRGVAAEFPGDVNVQVLLGDALMNLQPWDYWEAGGISPKGNGAEILSTLETAMALSPDHPAALHLYIHAVEASADPARGEAAADRLAALNLAAGHLAHMPAHIYNRVGRYAESIEANRAAIAADQAFLAAAGGAASPLYRFGYAPHNVHFLLVGAQSAGLGEDAVSAAERLVEMTSEELASGYAWVQAINTAPYTAHAQFSDPETILALPEPEGGFPFVRGFRHYARGLAFVRAGDLEAAQAERQAILDIVASENMSDLEAQFLPAGDVLGVAQRVVGARILEAEGKGDEAVSLLVEAAAIEATIPYMEPSYWQTPVSRTLGAVLLEQGRAQEAREAFRTALAQAPRDAWALWGLWQAEELIGEGSRADQARAAFREAWLEQGSRPTADRL